jgi:two-component system, LuxR family, sensor kinase FixL
MSLNGTGSAGIKADNPAALSMLKTPALVFGTLTALTGLLGIAGLYSGIPVLISVIPGSKPIAFSASACWLLFGILLILLEIRSIKDWQKTGITALLSLIILAGLIELPLNLSGMHSPPESFILAVTTLYFPQTSTPVSPVAVILILFSATALIILFRRRDISDGPYAPGNLAGVLGLAIALAGFTLILGYIYGTPFLYGSSFIPIAFTSALASFFMGCGLIAVAGISGFPLRYFTGKSIRARLLRYFLPLTVALVIIQNYLDWFLAWNLGINNVLVISASLALFCLITAYAVFQAAEALSHRVAREELLRKKAEETLRISEERYRGIFENMLNGFAYCRMIFENGKPSDFTYLVVNRAFGELTGLHGVEGRNVSEVIPGLRETDPKLLERYGEVAITGVPARFEIFVESLMMWFAVSVYSPRKGDFVAVFDVITERKAAEQDLKKTMGMLSRAQSIAHVGSWQYDVNKNIIEWSDELYRIFGILPGQFDLSLENIRSRIHPDDREKHDRIIAAAISTGHYDPEEYRIILPDGTFRYIAGYGDAETDEIRGSVHIIGVVQDVTERRLAAEQREILIKSLEQKNAELERFTYTVSHDLKSPLITIRGFLGLLEEDAIKGNIPQLKTDIDRISSAADKMQTLLTDLLALSRIGRISDPPERVLFGTIVQEAEELLAGLLRKRAVTIEIAPDLPEVYVDRTRIREVLVNLIENAQKFMGDQPEPEIHIGMIQKDEEPAFFVKDNGVGIEPQYQEKIFGLFEKLDARTEGSGVGLTIVKRIIEVHGGRIWVESEGEGKGTTVFFTLPVIGSKCIYNPAEGKNT